MASTKEKSVGVLESSLEKLEKLVEQLESGDLSLEESLKHFEQGVKLTQECQATLKAAEQKVEILLKKTADAEPASFENTELQ